MNSTLSTRWLAGLEVISKYFSPPSRRWDKLACRELNFRTFFVNWQIEINQILGFYVVYTKTIFYLSVGEGGGFLPSLFKSYCSLFVWDLLKSKTDISFNLELTTILRITHNSKSKWRISKQIFNWHFTMRYNSLYTLELFIFALINQAEICENGNIVIYITSWSNQAPRRSWKKVAHKFWTCYFLFNCSELKSACYSLPN